MRILASNPDTIGDMVLRQPLYHALEQAGHELVLIVRRSVAPAARLAAPSAQLLELPCEVYANDVAERWSCFEPLVARVQAFAPDLFVVAPFRWTLFEEKLAEALPGVRRVGMTGKLYAGNPYDGLPPESKLTFDATAGVTESEAEVKKNAALAEAVLGHPLPWIEPRLEPAAGLLEEARQALAAMGLEPGGYWVAAVAGTANVKIKQWPLDHWATVLSAWATQRGRRFLLTGLPDEAPDIRAMHDAMGSAADHAAVWAPADATFERLVGLIALSSGYVGHDTGPMHVAAACGKPVVAVFGGGTWPRFLPAVSPSVAVTVGVPCAGCGWSCSFHQPHCITSVPVDDVVRAAFEMEDGRITGREARVHEPTVALESRMLVEAAERVQKQIRSTADEARKAHDAARFQEQQAARHRTEIESRDAAARELAARLSREEADIAILRADLAEVIPLKETVGSLAKSMTGMSDSVAALSSSVASLQAQLAAIGEGITAIDAGVHELRDGAEKLEMRVKAVEPKVKPPKKPWKQRWAERIIGHGYYPPPRRRPLPKISIVTPVKNGEPFIRQTIESVLAQHYPDLEYIIVDGGSTDGTPDVIAEYQDRVARIISEPDSGMYDAIGKGFEAATGDVLGYLNADDMYEPGGLLRVGEFFRSHPRTKVIYHEDTVIRDGWRFPNARQPRVDVMRLLQGHTLFQDGVFFRRKAYLMAGGVNRELKKAGDWDLFVRLARMFGLRRVAGHVSAFRIRAGQISEDRASYDAELSQARQKFLRTFGIPGRVRCALIYAWQLAADAGERQAASRRRLSYPSDYCGKPLPPGQAPPPPLDQPVCPLTGKLPDRLLFSTQDTRFGDRRINYVYYSSKAGIALAYPPLRAEDLNDLYRTHYSDPIKKYIAPDPNYHSPYRNFRGGNMIERRLSRFPTPWWWFNKVTYHDSAAEDLLRAVSGRFEPQDERARFLDIGCFEGDLLDKLKQQTRWQLHGLEPNAKAVAVARGKGHTIWESPAEDAALSIPDGDVFDVVFLGQTIEHLDQPLVALRRLRSLLAPGGLLVVSLPNLDSKQIELFGPTWAHWHMPYHRTILSRRALRMMARLADMKVVRLRTRSHPYWSTMSVQLNRLGLGAVVPHSALFSNEIASHGVRLTGWSRLLWDWRGKGDYLFAVLTCA